jgi:hypothetical protein
MMVRSESGVAPTTNCIVMPAMPPGLRPSRGRPARSSSQLSTTTRRARSSVTSVRANCFSGAIRSSVSPQAASRFTDTRVANAVIRSICAASAPGTSFTWM